MKSNPCTTITAIRLIIILSGILIGHLPLSAQGIFRCPLEEQEGNHFRELFVINSVPYHDNGLGTLVDYLCTPYKSGLNVTATHFELVPAGNQYVSKPIARVVAAAAGQIVSKYNGYNDLTCVGNSPMGNYIILQHANGLITKYMNLRKNSLTAKVPGDVVIEGEYLGLPGNQTTLYGTNNAQYGSMAFEVRNSSNVVLDPFDTTVDSICYFHQRQSLWKDPTYMESKVWKSRMLAIEVSTVLLTDSCGGHPDNYKNHFSYGDQIDVAVKLANAADSLRMNIFNPLGVPIVSTLGKNYAFYFVMNRTGFIEFNIPLTGPLIIPGTYTINCSWYDSYSGYQTVKQTMSQYFTVGCVPDYTLTAAVNGESGCIAGNSIYSSAVCNSNSNVQYLAGNEIVLTSGFCAFNGSNVFIYTDPCIVSPRMEADEEGSVTSRHGNLSIFPVPAGTELNIQMEEGMNCSSFNIYNSTMQLVKSVAVNHQTNYRIQVDDLAPGIYFLDINGETQTLKRKFIVSR